MKINQYGNPEANTILLQMSDEHEIQGIESEINHINELTNQEYCLVTCQVDDWNRDLSPWTAPPVFGKEPFGGGAKMTLDFLRTQVISQFQGKVFVIGGYSLAGLFALWAGCTTDIFTGVAAASPSVWFPGFVSYADEHPIRSKTVYLSLGDREEKTKNPLMSQVGIVINQIHESIAARKTIKTTLEWNQGNHFKDPDLRTAKAFAWVVNHIQWAAL